MSCAAVRAHMLAWGKQELNEIMPAPSQTFFAFAPFACLLDVLRASDEFDTSPTDPLPSPILKRWRMVAKAFIEVGDIYGLGVKFRKTCRHL